MLPRGREGMLSGRSWSLVSDTHPSLASEPQCTRPTSGGKGCPAAMHSTTCCWKRNMFPAPSSGWVIRLTETILILQQTVIHLSTHNESFRVNAWRSISGIFWGSNLSVQVLTFLTLLFFSLDISFYFQSFPSITKSNFSDIKCHTGTLEMQGEFWMRPFSTQEQTIHSTTTSTIWC